MISFFADFIAGWIGGIFCVVTGYPFDTVKVRQQNFATSLYVAIRETYKYEGLLGFYRGMLPPLIAYGPSNSLLFGIYRLCLKPLDGPNPPKLENEKARFYLNQFIAGSIAGFFQTMMMCPVELLKIVVQTSTDGGGPWVHNSQRVQYASSREAFRGIIEQDGIRGLFKGLFPMMIRDVPTSGIYFVVYEALLPADRSNINVMYQIWAGGWAGIASISSVLPADVVKTRIQADDPLNPSYNGTMDCIRKLYKEEGQRIFWKGLPIITLRAFPAHAMLFVGYEMTMSFFK